MMKKLGTEEWASPAKNLETVRENILNALLIAITAISIVPIVTSLMRVNEIGWQSTMYFQILAYLVISVTTLFRQKVPYYHKALIIVIFSFLVGFVAVINMGLMGSGSIFLLFSIIFATMLLGVRYGLALIVACTITLITTALGVKQGWVLFDFNIEAAALSFPSWISKILAFTFFSTMLMISLGRLISYLVNSSNSLAERTEELQQTNAALLEEVAEKNRAETFLRESEERFKMLFEYAPEAYYLNDLEGTLLDGNRKAEDLLGYKREELIGQNFLQLGLLSTPDLQRAMELLTNNIDGKPTGPDEFVLKKKQGHQVAVEISTIPINLGGQDVVLGIARDITKRKQAEEALRESEEKLTRSKKMESLGLLAGGVAHDLNNVLSGIVGYPELLLLDLPAESKLRKPIEAMKQSGKMAAAIVQDLITVARGVAITREPLNLSDLVEEYLHSPELSKLKQFHHNISIKTDLDSELFNVSGSRVHIGKALMNLVSNAAEAIKGGGIVTISTTNRYMDRPLRGYNDVTIGEYVILSVSDNGSGIPSDDLDRIFEPFYTKKIMGRSGTGLGLAVVWNIMLDHKGYIDVITGEDGTTFELYFPMTRKEISEKERSLPIGDYKGHGETILVIDDEEPQRDISCKMLGVLGYQTTAVSSGEEAIDYLRINSVDLLVLDMIMDPGINGRETYERIREIHPRQKAIIVSGFAVTEDVKAAQKLGAGAYVKKPYTIEKIGLAVKEELES